MRTLIIQQRRYAVPLLAAAFVAAFLPLVIVASDNSDALPRPSNIISVVTRDGFEGGLHNWTKVGSSQLDGVSPGRGGAGLAARIRPVNAGGSAAMRAASWMHSSRKGARYVGEAWVRASGRAIANGPLNVRLTISSGADLVAYRHVGLSTHQWQRIAVPLTSTRDGAPLSLTVRATGVPGHSALLVDNAALTRVFRPEVKASETASTAFGASVDEGQLDWDVALRNSVRRYAGMDVVRVFEPDIRDTWAGLLSDVNRPVTVSFKAAPSDVLDGRYDDDLRSWFRQAPTQRPTWWTYWHEPEDDIGHGAFAADRYRAAWRHINVIAHRVGNPQLHPTLILMCWTAQPGSGRSVQNYYPGDFIDVMAWDCYNPPGWHSYVRPPDLFGSAYQATKRLGNRFAVGEFASVLVPGDDGSRRGRWLVNVARYLAAHNAAFAAYWDAKITGENYQLRDLPSRLAWRSVVRD